ncbi:hypothetical protein D3C77_759910 [compost metagenome]
MMRLATSGTAEKYGTATTREQLWVALTRPVSHLSASEEWSGAEYYWIWHGIVASACWIKVRHLLT